MRLFACPRSPRRMKLCRARMALAICGSTVSSYPRIPSKSVSRPSSFRSRLQRISSLTPRSAAPPGPAVRRHSPIVDAFIAAGSFAMSFPSYLDTCGAICAGNFHIIAERQNRARRPSRWNFWPVGISVGTVGIRCGFGSHVLNLHKLRQELVQPVDQLDAAFRFGANFQQFLQRLELERKLARNPVSQQAIGLVLNINIGWR